MTTPLLGNMALVHARSTVRTSTVFGSTSLIANLPYRAYTPATTFHALPTVSLHYLRGSPLAAAPTFHALPAMSLHYLRYSLLAAATTFHALPAVSFLHRSSRP